MILHLGHATPCQSDIVAPLFTCNVPAGFPSPADDHLDKLLNLNEYLIKHPAATFFCRVSGESMIGLGIFDGDILVVDRALTPSDGDVVLAAINGELTCKTLDKRRQQLLPANPRFPSIPISHESDFIVEGVVVHSIRSHLCTRL